ncbi:aminoglycoside phosphotransferase family protein [Agromyces aurantiacus]|uniref:Aminoglycoside phosphotransferase family protein n=1 Tax=Agromyces aurantiacus TaxID=165814 RepID=A0ABV9R233_9MICO|nr:aminoglycoside phosphotransferase family protein [Agromyces aurantiacus]MBM7502856.1 aminoglycoside phosphotransferase (APT) family kinase protein [Agromyces aurantiacus]
MADAPEADVEVDAGLVARLVAAQHPSFTGPVEPVANGWDNAIFRLGERWAVRMPRRSLADRLVRSEQHWMAVVAGSLPDGVRAPVPVAAGAPALGYPYAWSIVPWLEGEVAASVDPAERRSVAEALADVVAAIGVPAPPGAPANRFRGVPLAARDSVVAERLASGRLEQVVSTDVSALAAVWADAMAAPPWAGAPRWVHGDLHPGNLLLRRGEGGARGAGAEWQLAAVLDFGDLTAGDPATDLAAGWLVFDAPGRSAFRNRMAGLRATDGADWARARGWALAMGSAIVDTVGVGGPIGRVGAHALEQVLLD